MVWCRYAWKIPPKNSQYLVCVLVLYFWGKFLTNFFIFLSVLRNLFSTFSCQFGKIETPENGIIALNMFLLTILNWLKIRMSWAKMKFFVDRMFASISRHSLIPKVSFNTIWIRCIFLAIAFINFDFIFSNCSTVQPYRESAK